ncbi:hypothetical protein ABT56_00875 [Photobacterium aquae]|uniref:diguanylate cyclase n=2 Tax=Photobacterium aquae TaxID=1195763 RepID=A0A0J1HAY4_9GAMM|nr:hypothetical protein ABT56_00875 [Photobacterium aquae]
MLSVDEQALVYLAQYYIQIGQGRNVGRARPYLEKMKQIAKEHKSVWLSAEIKFIEAFELMDQREYALAQFQLENLKEQAEEMDYNMLLGRTLKWLGNLDADRSEYKAALNKYNQSYDIFAKCNNYQQLVRVMSNIASVYIDMQEWNIALHYSREALDLYSKYKLNNPYIESYIHINAAVIAKYIGNREEREKHITTAMALAKQSSVLRVKIAALVNLSAYYLDVGKEDKAVDAANQCLVIAKQFGGINGHSVASCHESLSEAYLGSGWIDGALEHADKAMGIYQETKEKARVVYMYELMAKIYEAKHLYEKALQYYKRFTEEGRDLLFDVRSQKLIDIQEVFDNSVNEKEIKLLKAENALARARLAERKAMENTVRLLGLLSVVMLYFLFRRYNKLKKEQAWLLTSNKMLVNQSTQDPLTGLNNRRYFEWWLSLPLQEIYPDGLTLAVIDVDHFKKINDHFGHDTGDEVLKILANRLRQVLGEDEHLIRWGGEEFVAILSGTQCEERLRCFCDVICRDAFQLAKRPLRATISVGGVSVADAETFSENWRLVFREADKALYRVKSSGRNNVDFSYYQEV